MKVKVLLWKRAILCVEQYRMQSTLSNKRLCERPIIGGNKQTNNNIYVSDSKQQTNNNIIIYAPDSKNYLVRLFLGLLVTLSVWSIPNRVQKRQHQNYIYIYKWFTLKFRQFYSQFETFLPFKSLSCQSYVAKNLIWSLPTPFEQS